MTQTSPVRDEAVFRSLFESSPGQFVVLEPGSFRIVAVSDAYLRLTRRERADLVDRIFFDVFPDDPAHPEANGSANLRASLERVTHTLQPDIMGLQRHDLFNPDTGVMETRLWTPLNTPVLAADGTLHMIIHRTEDVTDLVYGAGTVDATVTSEELPALMRRLDLQRHTDMVNASRLRLQGMFREASLGIAATDFDGRFVETNDAFCRLLGYSHAELRGMTVYDITHPDDRSGTRDMRTQLAKGGQRPLLYGKRYVTSSGGVIWVRLNASLLHDTAGNAVGIMAIVEDITRQRQVEDLLRQAGKIGRIGGWQVAREVGGLRTYWSREVYELFDYEGDEPPPRDLLFAMYHPAHRQQVVQAIDRCWQSGTPFDIEFPFTSFRGVDKWLRLAGEAERDPSGRVTRLVGAAQDITRQRRDQDSLKRLGSQLLGTLENMAEAYFLLDRNWCVRYMNAAAERMFRRQRGDVLEGIFWEVFSSFRGTPAHDGLIEASRNGQPWTCQHYDRQLEEWLDMSVVPTAEGLTLYLNSITAEKRLQHDIARSQERLSHITEVVMDVVWDVDLVARRGWYNDGLQRRFGIDIANEECDLDLWMRRVHPEDLPVLVKDFEDLARSSGTAWLGRYRFRCGDDRYVHFEDRGYIERDATGRPVRIVGGSMDITDRIEAGERQVQSQRLEAVGQLTGGIAHDFNNLLTVIIGNIQLLHEQLEGQPKLRAFTHAIEVAANRGANLTRHLLAFSRRQALQPRSVDVNHLLATLSALVTRTLGENIIVESRIDPALWTAQVDPAQLEMALLNLCLNSRDAMPEGGTITLGTRNTHLDDGYCADHADLAPGDFVQITVADTGIGMAPEVLDRVFEPFFTTKEVGKGTGLGLSTVFGFVKQSQGHINIYSEPGQGTTIRLYLPRAQTEAVTESLPGSAAPPGGGEKILLVEDNALVRNYAMEQLRKLGYDVHGAADAAAALDLLQRTPGIQLLFTDVVMPGLSGYELAQRACAMQPGLRVLYTSGYTLETMRRDGMATTGMVLLEKPYGRNDLAVKIRAALAAPSDEPEQS